MALSDDQKLLRAAAGAPAQFSLLQASGTDGNARVETWSYPQQGTDFLFANGQYVGSRQTNVTKDLPTTTTMPEGLPLKASRSQVAKLMGAAPDLTVPMPDELAPNGTVDVYGRGLVAAFVDDELVAANTLPSNAQKTGTRTPTANIKFAEFLLNEELARRGRQLERLQLFVPSAQAAGLGGRLLHASPYMFVGYVLTQAITICLAKDPCSAATEEWLRVKRQTSETLDKLIEEGHGKGVDTHDLEKIKSEIADRFDERLAEKISELKKERKQGFLAGIIVVGTEGLLAMTGWGAALSVAGHIGLSAGAVTLDLLLDKALASPDNDLNAFIGSDLVPTLKTAPAEVQKALATKLLQIAVKTQCGSSADEKCAAGAAADLLRRTRYVGDKILRRSLKDSWCESAKLGGAGPPECEDHPFLIGTAWSFETSDKTLHGTVDFYGGGSGGAPYVIEVQTDTSGIGCNMPVANFAYDKNKLGFTCGNVAISATIDEGDLSKWTGIVVVKGQTRQFEGERLK